MLYETRLEACRAWVETFNAIPTPIIDKLQAHNEFEFQEVTLPTKHDRVYLFDKRQEGEIVGYDSDNKEYLIALDEDNSFVKAGYPDDFEVTSYEEPFPMWGTMWAFSDSIDNDWLSGEFLTDGLRLMSDCGFRIYEQEDYGYVFGIDGAGYDFYEAHWLPLYKARGLKWDKETRAEDEANT